MTARASATDQGGDTTPGSVLGVLALSPVGWIADGTPVPRADRRPYGDERDSAVAQASAVAWSIGALVIAVTVDSSSWWAVPGVVLMLALILPTRTAAGLGGSLVVPHGATDTAAAPRSRVAVLRYALGMAPAGTYAAVQRRESDPNGLRGRRAARLRAGVLVLLPTLTLTLDAATGGAVVTRPFAGAWAAQAGPVTITLPVLARAALAGLVILTLSASTVGLGRYHAEDLELTGTARYPGLAGRLAAALGVGLADFDRDSELHWNDPRHRGAGFHARQISGRVAAALLDEDKRARIGALFPEWELVEWSHSTFRLALVTETERARRSTLRATEGLAEGVAHETAESAGYQETIDLDTDDIDWHEV